MLYMENLHNHLSEKQAWYRKWHERPSYNYVHFFVLVTFVLGFFMEVNPTHGALGGSISDPTPRSLFYAGFNNGIISNDPISLQNYTHNPFDPNGKIGQGLLI